MKLKAIFGATALLCIGVSSAQQPIMRVPFDVDKTETVRVTSDSVYVEVKGESNELDGDWVIYNVQGKKIEGEELPTIIFEISKGRFYGNNGCNVINGDLLFTGENGLQFLNPISTMRFCANDNYSHLVNSTLEQVRAYKISKYRHVYYVDLLNSKGQTVMILRNNNVSFLNGAWQATEINGQPVSGDKVKLVIDIPQKHIHANAGCNIINGQIYADTNKMNAIQFTGLLSTRMLCPDMDTETRFLVALEQTEAAIADANNGALFYDNAGNVVMKLVRIPFSQLQD